MKWQKKNKANENVKEKQRVPKERIKHKPTLVEHARLVDEEPQESPPAENVEYFYLSSIY